MRYHIETIPVWDALKQGGECFLCTLRRQTEQLLIQRSLGASVMSPQTRALVNQAGFCTRHQVMLYEARDGNRLGHALMMLSHLQTIRPKAEQILSNAGTLGNKRYLDGLTRPSVRAARARTTGKNSLSCLTERCHTCEELEAKSKAQAEALLHLWKTDAGFRLTFSQSKGLCIPDTSRVFEQAPGMLSGDVLADFQTTLSNLLKTSLENLEKELTWYTQKFDYRNADQPWGTSKDALERTVNKLRGRCLGNELMQDDPVQRS